MKAADESDAPSDQNPAAVYLDGLLPSGRRSMRRELARVVAIFTDQAGTDATAFDWSQISRLQVEKLRSAMVDRNAAAGTVNHMLSGVRSTVRIAWELGLVDDKTWIAVEDEPNEKPQQRRRAGRYVKRNEVRRLFATAPGTDPIGARDAALLALLYGAGLQRSEAVALQLADYDEVSGAVTVRDDERQVHATDGGKEAIHAWIAIRGDWPGALLAPVGTGERIRQRGMTAQAVMVRVRSITVQAGVAPVTPNDLRLTYLTELEKKQLDARTKGQARRGAIRSAPSAKIRESSQRGVKPHGAPRGQKRIIGSRSTALTEVRLVGYKK